MLSEEKAIIEVRKLRDANKRNSLGKSIDTVLNLIDRLQKENEEKDKQIDLMAEMIDELSEYYTRYWGKNNKFCKEDCIKKDIDCKDCIKQYFEKITKEKK